MLLYVNSASERRTAACMLKLLYVNSASERQTAECTLTLLYVNSASERQTAECMLMLLYVNSAIPLSNLRETPQTCQGIWSTIISHCCIGYLQGTNGRPTYLSAWVSILHRYRPKIPVPIQAPQWGAADAEIKVPPDENTELKGSPFEAWSRSVYCYACYAYCRGFLPC